jgi:drug/metabolite transporter (DMT)-like permease
LSKQFRVLIVLVTLSVLWGSSFLAIKVVIDTIPPILGFGIRFAASGAILLAIYTFHTGNKKVEHIGIRQWKDALILGASIILGGQGLLVWGAQYLSSEVTALLNSTIPLWIAIIAALTFIERLTRRMGLGLAAGFAGLVTLINPFVGNNTNLNLIGIVSLTLSSIFWAAGSLYSTRSHMPVSILASAGMLMLAGGIMLTITSFAAGEFRDFQLSRISATSLVAYLYLIFLCTAVGYAEFFWLLRVESASVANSFAYIVPVIAVFFGWAILKESLSLQTLIATSIIMIGVALMVTSSSTKKTKRKVFQK